MRAVFVFVLTFGLSLALLVWLSEELRVIPRGAGWLLLCFVIAGFSVHFFGKGGKAEEVGSAVAAAVADKVAPFSVPSSEEEALWALAAREFEGEQRRPGLYAKALASANGDEGRAKAYYLKARVAELKASDS